MNLVRKIATGLLVAFGCVYVLAVLLPLAVLLIAVSPVLLMLCALMDAVSASGSAVRR